MVSYVGCKQQQYYALRCGGCKQHLKSHRGKVNRFVHQDSMHALLVGLQFPAAKYLKQVLVLLQDISGSDVLHLMLSLSLQSSPLHAYALLPCRVRFYAVRLRVLLCAAELHLACRASTACSWALWALVHA
jgi:hypothetical protein